MSNSIFSNLTRIVREMESAAQLSHRSRSEISLVAVSKKQSVEAMAEYQASALQQGVPVIFGESYIQEFNLKKPQLTGTFESHLLGPLQSNKARDAVRLFDLIQSVHSRKILELLAKEAERAQKQQRVLLQVNISKDGNKSGFSPEDVEIVLNDLRGIPSIVIEGFMAITALYDSPEQTRGDFRELTNLVSSMSGAGTSMPAPTISMGMSSDFALAIEEGSTMVRIGTALFGARG